MSSADGQPNDTIRVAVHRRTRSVTLDRPERGNALDHATVVALHRELDLAEADPDCVAFSISGTGTAFCAGADVTESIGLLDRPDDLLAHFTQAREFADRLATGRLVSVAVVHGLAAAGGLELVTACDLVVAGRSARFADRHARYGFVPAFGATARLTHRLPRAVAAWLLLGDGELDADGAHRAGLVSMVVDDDHLGRTVEDLHDRLAGLDATALESIKRLMDDPAEAEAVADEARAVAAHLAAGGYRMPERPLR